MAESTSTRRPRRALGRAIVAIVLFASLALPLVVIAQDTTSTTIVGDYTVVITVSDVPRDLANGPALYGRWRISFAADGTYTTARIDVGQMVAGSYKVDGDQITITDESGLLSCGNASIVGSEVDASKGTYKWERNGERLNFIPVDDKCAGRKILLSTRQLTGFVACATQPLVAGATPEAEASPEAASPLSELQASTPEASPQAVADVTQAIDALLDQMTSCWATGKPALFLPLMTTAFRTQFLQSTNSATDPISALAGLMSSSPFVWERAGDVNLIDPSHATALVRQAVGNQEDFVRYDFMVEDGVWRWNGTS